MTQPSLLDQIACKENRRFTGVCLTCGCDIRHLHKRSRRCPTCADAAAIKTRVEWHAKHQPERESSEDIERKFQAALAQCRREGMFRLNADTPLIGSSLGGL